MEPRHISSQNIEAQAVRSPQAKVPEDLSAANMSFEGSIKTLDQLRQAVIQKMGAEKGQEMYDKFLNSILISCFGTVHKDMDRAQKASKRMRSIYRE